MTLGCDRGSTAREASEIYRPNLVIEPPAPREREQLGAWLDQNRPISGSPVGDTAGQSIPAELMPGLVFIATALLQGRGVGMVALEARLTTQQAAGILGVTRPTVVRLLEAGHIPFERCGSHRRIRPRDLFRYQDQASSAAVRSGVE